MDWSHAYQEHQKMIRDQLHEAQRAGVPVYRLASGPVHPRKLSYSGIAKAALRDAEHIVNEAINRENERLRKIGR